MKTLYNILCLLLVTLPAIANTFDDNITITDFKIEKSMIVWTTEKEIDNKEFIIEASVDGQHWTEVDHLEGESYSDIDRIYKYSIERPVQTTYYRLKREDLEGNISVYDKVIKYEVMAEQPFIKYEIENQKVLFSTNDGKVNVILMDADGHEEFKGYIKDGEEIEVSEGPHFLKLTSAHQHVFKQVIIE